MNSEKITDMIRVATTYPKRGVDFSREKTGESFSFIHQTAQEHKLLTVIVITAGVVVQASFTIFCLFINGAEYYTWFKSLPFMDIIFSRLLK